MTAPARRPRPAAAPLDRASLAARIDLRGRLIDVTATEMRAVEDAVLRMGLQDPSPEDVIDQLGLHWRRACELLALVHLRWCHDTGTPPGRPRDDELTPTQRKNARRNARRYRERNAAARLLQTSTTHAEPRP